GALREVLRHQAVKTVRLVEIEEGVITFAKKWFPKVSDGAFDDTRVSVTIADGAQFVQETDETFDLIIVDSTDPVGPGAALFTPEFYAGCRRILRDEGIVVSQCGLPFLQAEELKRAAAHQRTAFSNVRFYGITVPAYSGGVMTLGFATDSDQRPETADGLRLRIEASGMPFQYYAPGVHAAAFRLPPYIAKLVA
ncbi:MAG: polyamine aminopropyltransferase, partial [Pseudomonadota bacterium]